ncbi:hydroxyacid dehydrogenase [Paenibacillus cremeus]|nr:hydroxyacid dehydrogenase [Paenibacillus cremeus]
MKTLVTVWKQDLREVLFPEEVCRQLEAVSSVDWVPLGQPYEGQQLEREIHRYDAVITSWGSPKITSSVLAQAGRLRFIGHAAGTLTPYLDPSVFERELVIVNANSALARSTAEFAVTLMLTGSWRVCSYWDSLRDGRWNKNNSGTVPGLYGQSIGIVGLGEVSREVIRLLRGFNPHIRLYSPYCTREEAQELGVTLCSLEEVLRNSQVVSLHDTLTAATRGMLGREQLRLLPDGALLVNTARGPIIEEAALLDELASGRIYAALDVYDIEPLPADHPLPKLPNVMCFPHIGAYSEYWKSQQGAMIVEDLSRFVAGQPLLRQITAERFQRMTLN